MRTHAIIVPPPLLNDDLCLAQGRKYLPVQQFGIMEQEHQF